ncbi:Holo-[acyl-carrier-protein] synthase [Frankliniella fusca]|uniref:Holo-[acyl-carrier-protein] synthase n=1 Tax=Frankliniella fusca TaxID=407009 RepID=A0AAE1GYU8_9NEOP|nr:Holo-[acyl-carrier-protein] synthase [Frankliniella fusca]KAK3917842.1 Holo-[acyl-carrier-protein] synthase [Frankliniella fusca]
MEPLRYADVDPLTLYYQYYDPNEKLQGVEGDATVGKVPELGDDDLALVYVKVPPAFHPVDVWSLSIRLQRHRSARHVRDFIGTLDDIARTRCNVATDEYSPDFCAVAESARNTSAAAYAQLFPTDEGPVFEPPANTSVFIPEYVSFHEASVNELWSQLSADPGQSAFADRLALQKLTDVIRAKAARLRRLADDEAVMWSGFLEHSSAPSAPSAVLACHVLQDAFAHAASMLPPGLTFNSSLNCSDLPPLSIRRSDKEIEFYLYLDAGVVCSDTLAYPLPMLFNDTHFMTLSVPHGTVLACAGTPPERQDLCAAELYRAGTDHHGVCVIEPLRAVRAFLLHGYGRIFVVSRRPISVVFNFKVNRTAKSQRATVHGRKLITYADSTIVLLKGLKPALSIVKLVAYAPVAQLDAPLVTASSDVFLYVFLFVFLLAIVIPMSVFLYFLYIAYVMMGAAMNI